MLSGLSPSQGRGNESSLPCADRQGAVGFTPLSEVLMLVRTRTRISTTPYLLWHFSPGDKIENCPAQFLPVCWIVHVDFKVRRLCDGFSVSNALLLSQSLPAFIGHNLDKIGDGTVL